MSDEKEKKTLHDIILEKYPNKTFAAHMDGIAKKFKIAGMDSTITKNDAPKIAQAYKDYTHKDYKGENLHGGKTIKFAEFVKSAYEYF